MQFNNQVGMHTGGMGLPLGAGVGPNGALPFAPTSILPARPNLPDDPVIPHNGFATIEEGEKAFTHLLRKAGVDATWTWDQDDARYHHGPAVQGTEYARGEEGDMAEGVIPRFPPQYVDGLADIYSTSTG